MMEILRDQLVRMIDYTSVKSAATRDDVLKLCNDAKTYGFGCVCVNLVNVSLSSKLLKGTKSKVCSTIGFPLGATITEVKALEAKMAIEMGAQELDMVINIGALKSKEYDVVKRDIKKVVNEGLGNDVLVKAIIETAYLTSEEKVIACEIAKKAGAKFVKTSTGFFGGATVEDVKLMRETVGREVGVKAAGGIRTFNGAVAMIKAGASRIGTSAGIAIMNGFHKLS